MSFLATIVVFGLLAVAGSYVGDPFRPDTEPGMWRVTIIEGE